MKRWIGALIAVVLACVPLILNRATSPDLLRDSDTEELLINIRSHHNPLHWFVGDWPLHNHFYRPVATLAFEWDNHFFGNNPAGYGLTNALLCVACIILLFWFLRELTDRPLLAGGGAVLFALQLQGYQGLLTAPTLYLVGLVAVVGMVRHGRKLSLWLPAVLVMLYTSEEIGRGGELGARTISWLPGRTATVMTVFALIAMAAYARYERLSGARVEPSPTPLDPPATRTTKQTILKTKGVIVWPIVSLLSVALALATYEQAVMLPAILLAVAFTMKWSRIQVRWLWQAGFWTLLVGYLILRKEVMPSGYSQYQAQQFRHGPGVYISLWNYIAPFTNGFSGFMIQMQSGPLVLLNAAPYAFPLSVLTNLTALFQARRQWVFAVAGYGMSFIAFLPMAWVKQFAHYEFWPMALRSLFTMSLVLVCYELVLIACSPPTRQAPPRPDPAPGSLPHP